MPTYPATTPERNVYYYAAMMSQDIWKHADGKWQHTGYPGGPIDWLFDYSFEFPGRKIKKIEVTEFDPSATVTNESFAQQIVFDNTRYIPWLDFAARAASGYTSCVTDKPEKCTDVVNGYGTERVTFKIRVDGSLNALQPENLKEGREGEFHPNVEGWRHYFPSFVRVELEPLDNVKKAYERYWTTTGKSLNGFYGLRDKETTIEAGKSYTFQAQSPSTSDLTYKGHKQNSGSAPPAGGSFTSGDAKITNFDGKQDIYIYYYFEQAEGPPPPPPPYCDYTISPPQKGQVRNGSVMDPAASGMLRADNRGAELFDVQQGIPTSENLFANVLALNYLYQNQFANMTGEVTYKVDVRKTYLKTWTVPSEDPEVPPLPMSKTEIVQEQVTVKRPYSYWQIDNLEVYGIDRSTVSNYALGGQGGTITLQPDSYLAPVLQSSHKEAVEDHVTPAPCDAIDLGVQELPGGNQEPPTPSFTAEAQAEAEKAIGKNKVRNDRLLFNGATIMNDGIYDEAAPMPGVIPAPTPIGQDVLYRNGLTISRTLQNRADNPTTGQIYYELLPGNINGGADRSFAIPNMNTVTVHTPTVMYPAISDDREHNQKINPAAGRAALILDREFAVSLPTSGQHRNIPGYGNRDYQKYITIKQVYFPFDVYDAETGQFYAKNQWISVPVAQQSKTFFLPVWVDEGFYTVSFRSFAENYPPGFTHETAANMNWMNHAATNTVPVDVVGRLYDFRITDIADYNWERVFRTAKGSAAHSANVYYVGNRGIDGAVLGNRNLQGEPVGGRQLLSLPIRPGSHPEYPYRNWVIKSGYHFKFEVKTKGNMDGLYDAVRLYPSFYFVKKDGTGRIPVDLYYHDYTNGSYFVRIGSSNDRVERQVVLNDRLRNVPQAALNDTARFMASVHGVNDFLTKAKKPKTVGRLSWLLLPYEMRTLHGPKTIPSTVPAMRALGSMQTWYGEYSLPATVYAVRAGTNVAEYGRKNGGIREDAPIFLKDGYLIVNFNLETIRDRDLDHPYLRYYPLEGERYPYNNQWAMEGFVYRQQDKSGHTFILKDGDVAFYHPDKSSNADFGSAVPH